MAVSKQREPGSTWYQLHIIPPDPAEPIRDEEFETEAEAQVRKSELDAQKCRVTLTPCHMAAPVPPAVSQVTWTPIPPADVVNGAKNLGKGIGWTKRLIKYSGLNVSTLLNYGAKELELAQTATQPEDATRSAINAVHYAKMALDCLFDAYLERDFLDVTMRPNAGFYEKVQLVRKRLGDELVPDVLIKKVVADPRDDAQHDRKPPSIDEVVTAIQAARTVVGAMRAASDPLTGHAVAGALGAYHQTLPSGERRPVFYGFPPVFGLIWRGADGKVRAGVGTAGTGDNRHIAEVQYAPFENFDELQRLDLLRCFDESATHSGWTQNEEHLRELMVAARLDQP